MYAAVQANGVYGFFSPGVHSHIPNGAVEITASRHLELLVGQIAGKIIVCGPDGYPMLTDASPPDDTALAAIERAWRDGTLSAVMWLRERHRDQLEISASTTLTAGQFNELLVYMQALRDWPQSPDFPDSQHRPVAPDWIATQTQ